MTHALYKQSLISKRSWILTTFSLALTRLSYGSIANGNVDSTIPLIANYFGTKGRYEDVNPYLRDNILAVNTSTQSSDCSAIHLTAIIRHGTRYPTTKNIQKIHRLYNLVVNEASSAEEWLDQIKSEWKMWYTEDMDGKLVQKGRDDHKHLAVRLATTFPSLVSEENLRAGRMKFTTSSKHRCVDSIEAFQAGLLNLWKVKDVGPLHEIDDDLMRFFEKCQKFVEGVENNPGALLEVKLFKASAAMQKVQRKMADRLQVPCNLVSPAMVEAAFFLCAYEFAIKSLHSPWCQLFDEEDALVLEYKNDLKQYWKRGYGHDINPKSSCTLFHDLFNRLDLISSQHGSGHVSEAVTVQVGHGETLLPLLSLLGFFRDVTPLTAANFPSQGERAFRTSRIVPYAANLLFVLYECGEGLRLQVLLNESPVTFPGMEEQAPLYREVREHYGALLRGCDFHQECGMSPPQHSESHHPPSHTSEL